MAVTSSLRQLQLQGFDGEKLMDELVEREAEFDPIVGCVHREIQLALCIGDGSDVSEVEEEADDFDGLDPFCSGEGLVEEVMGQL